MKRAKTLLKQGYEAHHTGEPDYSLDHNTVFKLAYFNYAKANKLKAKASKKFKKLLAGVDDENKSMKGMSFKSIKSNKSTNEDADENFI
jgi:hypothetical protein